MHMILFVDSETSAMLVGGGKEEVIFRPHKSDQDAYNRLSVKPGVVFSLSCKKKE